MASPATKVTNALLVRHRAMLGRASWNLVDQLLSALTNVVLSVVVARSVDAAGFGAFSVAFLTFSLMVGVGRALVGQPMGIRFSGATGQELHDATARALGTTLALAAPAGLVVFLVGLGLGGFIGPVLMALGVTLPGLLLQDACRTMFIVRTQPRLAAANDALWAIVQFSVIAVLLWTGRAPVWGLVLAWGGAAAVCVAAALWQLRVRPRPGAARQWARQNRDLVGYLLAEYLLTTGTFHGGILVVGAFIGLDSVGAVRAAQVLVGPLGIVGAAMMSFALPEVARRTELTSTAKWKAAATISGVMVVISIAYVAVLLVLPSGVGLFLFRASWEGASGVLLPIALGTVALGAGMGPALVIYALGHASKTFRLTVIEAPMALGAMFIGARLGGIQGAAWGMCLDQIVLVPLWFLQLHLILRPAQSPRWTRELPDPRPP